MNAPAPATATADTLGAVLRRITADPDRHVQDRYGQWRPGTGPAYCVAAWTLVLAGRARDLHWSTIDADGGREVLGLRAPRGKPFTLARDGLRLELAAAELLGLDHDTAADCLFDPDLTVEDLWSNAFELTGGAVRRDTAAPHGAAPTVRAVVDPGAGCRAARGSSARQHGHHLAGAGVPS